MHKPETFFPVGVISALRSTACNLNFENSVEISMLFNPPEVEGGTLEWIKDYAKKYDNPLLFDPHITVGFGETDKFILPIEFTASTIALCQLGNHCTCRKVIISSDL